MPSISIYKCSECAQVLHEGWGGYRYVENEQGDRLICPHPGEDDTISDVLGLSSEEFHNSTKLWFQTWWWSKNRKKKNMEVVAILKKKTGFNSDCICLDCLKDCVLDLGNAEKSEQSWRWYYNASIQKDERKCPHCTSKQVRTVFELIGKQCPFCKTGIIVEEFSGIIS